MRGSQIRTFATILGITALVWLAVVMSEQREYDVQVQVSMTGFDAKRFAVVQADSSLTLRVSSTGFNALLFGLQHDVLPMSLDVTDEAFRHYRTGLQGGGTEIHGVVAVQDLSAQLATQLASFGIKQSGSHRDSLKIVLRERSSRVFRPRLANLRVNFPDGYGLYGDPKVVPQEVTLYGPANLLDSIEAIDVVPTQIEHLDAGGIYRVALDTSWRRLGDIRSSATALSVQLQVRRYVEREYQVAVSVDNADSTLRLRLYPDHVTIRAWVAQDDLPSITPERFSVTVNNPDIVAGEPRLYANLDRFPANVRIHSVQPEEIEYVIIK